MDKAARNWLIFIAAFVALLLWLSTQPATPANGPYGCEAEYSMGGTTCE